MTNNSFVGLRNLKNMIKFNINGERERKGPGKILDVHNIFAEIGG